MFDYGAKYGVDDSGPYFIYDNSKGEPFRFTVPEFRDMLENIKAPKTGIVPSKFKVSASGNAPWFERPEVNRSKLDELIASRGTPAGSAPAGKQPVSTDAPSRATNGPGARNPRPSRVSESRSAPGKGTN